MLVTNCEMDFMQSSFDFRGLRCFIRAGDANHYDFLPLEPDLRRDSMRKPLLTMIGMGDTGYLLFTATWSAPDSDVDALRTELALRSQEPDTSRIVLSFAPVVSTQCSALIGDGSGAFQTLATSTTSGIPPYDAVFNLWLQNERLTQAQAGLRGELGFLGIEYVASLPTSVTAQATFRSLTSELLPWLKSHDCDSRKMSELLEQAVADGLASIVIDVPDPHLSELAIELHDRVIARAAQLLPRWIEQDGSGDIQVSVTLEQDVREPVRAFADIGAIVSATSV
jgi:hypothetical protein